MTNIKPTHVNLNYGTIPLGISPPSHVAGEYRLDFTPDQPEGVWHRHFRRTLDLYGLTAVEAHEELDLVSSDLTVGTIEIDGDVAWMYGRRPATEEELGWVDRYLSKLAESSDLRSQMVWCDLCRTTHLPPVHKVD